MELNADQYIKLLTDLLAGGYQFLSLEHIDAADGCVALRHDVDFDCYQAYQMAQIEQRLGVQANYYFLLTSEAYNLLSPVNRGYVQAIQAMGHNIGLHFNVLAWKDPAMGLVKEKTLFESWFHTSVELITLHRPPKYLVNSRQRIGGVAHSYMPRYISRVTYVSDSGNDFNSAKSRIDEAYHQGDTIHLLIHPIWWMSEGQSAVDVLRGFQSRQAQDLHNYIQRHCRPYREYFQNREKSEGKQV